MPGVETVPYDLPLYRPPSEANSYILQGTLGCSWNRCIYCNMYRTKRFQVRPLATLLAEMDRAGAVRGDARKLFVADGDALAMGMDHWLPILEKACSVFPNLRQVSCYATARNILDKRPEDLRRLRDAGLSVLYVGPESGDAATLKRIAKGAGFAEHVEAARLAREAGMDLSAIFLLGAGGVERSAEHARASGELATAMDPRWLAALTLTVIPGTPIHRLQRRGAFRLPSLRGLLEELRLFVATARPTAATFRTNHASNHLALGGELPRDRARILATVDAALAGRVPLRPEWARGL